MNNALPPRHISSTPRSLVIEWGNGDVNEFLSIWLRDNRPADRDASNGQRLVDIMELPPDPRIQSTTLRPDAVLVRWEDAAEPTSFDLSWLARHGSVTASNGSASNGSAEPETRMWLHGASVNAERDFAWGTLPDGRTAFSSARFLRHLRGCYLTRDSVYSETALLRRKFAQEGNT